MSVRRHQVLRPLQPLFNVDKSSGGFIAGNSPSGAVVPDVDGGAYCTGVYNTAPDINVAVGDVLFMIVVRRRVNGGATAAPSVIGTHTHGTITQIGSDAVFNAGTLPGGSAGVYAALITGAGTLNCAVSTSESRMSWVVVPGLDVTSLATTYGTVKVTIAAEDNASFNATPDPPTGAPSYLLTLWGGGGASGSPEGQGDFAYSDGPIGEVPGANVFGTVSYGGFSDIFLRSYYVGEQTFTVTHPTIPNGGQVVWQIELKVA